MRAALPGRAGHVGGVESLTLDGRRYWFGFDFSSDMVVSPLIDDADEMAAFASAHMRQTTGEHDAAYWAELVGWAVDGSDLVGEDADRAFTTRRPDPEQLSGGHLLYLLEAAAQVESWFAGAPGAAEAFARLGFEDEDELTECVDQCLEAVGADGPEARPDEVTVLRHYLTTAVGALPDNWGPLFGEAVRASLDALIPAGAAPRTED